jgi:tryptophan synthase alpha chain
VTNTNTRLHGVEAIAATFTRTANEGRAAFMPFFPMGYPDYEVSLDAITAMAEVGVDAFEIGVPFSDPLADGPTIQAASQVALENGITVQKTLDGVKALRERGVQQPILMFSYLNPILAYGEEAFVKAARVAGADGMIIPDLPPEEAHLFTPYCKAEGMALIFFLAPTSNSARIAAAAQNATGFIYVVSVTGVTGARIDLPPDLKDFIARLRQETDQPLVLGFGISTPEQARSMNGLVNGFIVGSALVRQAKAGVDAVRKLATDIRTALD